MTHLIYTMNLQQYSLHVKPFPSFIIYSLYRAACDEGNKKPADGSISESKYFQPTILLLLIQVFTAVNNNKHAHKYNNICIYSTGIVFYMYQWGIACTRNKSYINTDLSKEHLICL